MNTFRLQIKLEAPPVLDAMPARADRSEMIGALTGALALLAADKDKAGLLYRRGLVGRIKSILDREMGR